MSNSNPAILITGGTGFAGSHLVKYLFDQGQTNVHVTSYGSNTDFVNQILDPDNIHQIDLTNSEDTDALIEQVRPDQIYHLAALSGVGSSFNQVKKVIESNFEIELSLFSAVKEHTPQAKILAIGSALEYRPTDKPLSEKDELGPVNPYGVSKVLQDSLAFNYFVQHHLQIVRVRPFNHIGERQALGFVVPDFAMQIAKIEQGQQKFIEVGNLDTTRDFTDVKDMVAAYALLMKKGEVGEVYNIGSGQGITIQQILDKLVDLAQKEIEVKTSTEKHRPSDIRYLVCDNRKIKQLGWKPQHSVNQTLERILNYYRKQLVNQ
ncbi:MAG: GDP-mannose 4,6-dehydratase [Patescibacteria group bacterium]|nr:GDP-mannose 4,6-dehydratase [Patescibacteria group bacterium]